MRYQCAGALSTEQEIPRTPEGPARPVAVTNWVPAVDGAFVGPESDTVGSELSMWSVLA